MTVQFKIPDSSTLVDAQFFQVPGPDGVVTGYQWDEETSTLFKKESQIIIPTLHGVSHISNDPVPLSTTDTPGLQSADDKVKLDSLVQMRLGVLGFAGAGFCALPGTRILISDGSHKPIEKFRVGELAITHKGVPQFVTNVYSREVNERIAKITTRRHPRGGLKLTLDHKILAVKRRDLRCIRPDCQARANVPCRHNARRCSGCEYENLDRATPRWIKAKSLEKGDYIVSRFSNKIVTNTEYVKISDYVENCVAREGKVYAGTWKNRTYTTIHEPTLRPMSLGRYQDDSLPISVDLMRLFGYFLAEGYTTSKKLVFAIGEHELETIGRDIISVVENMFSKKCTIRIRNGCAELQFHDVVLSRLFRALFGHGAHHKRIPQFIMELPSEKQRHLLIGLMRGDGHARFDKKCKHISIGLCNQELVEQTCALLERCGGRPSLTGKKVRKSSIMKSGTATSYVCTVQASTVSWLYRAMGKEFNKTNTFTLDVDTASHTLCEITATEHISYSGPVYDLEIENDHSMVADGLVIHNSDDGGFLQGDVILAAGSEFISLERIGNVVRFTVDTPLPLSCLCEEQCAQIFFIQDESEASSIRPPSCNGIMPSISGYGELKIFTAPAGTIFDPANPSPFFNSKGEFPTLIFKRYDDGITANEAEIEVVLKRNVNLTTQTGWSMTPGPTGVTETVWFTGTDDDGAQIRFELKPESEPGLLGALLYKGHTLTRRMAVITNFTAGILSTNQYKVKFWDIQNEEALGDEFTATNTWRFENPEASATDPVSPKRNILDATKMLLPLGTLVQIWEFNVAEIGSTDITRAFFNLQPELPASALWAPSGFLSFGDFVSQGTEITADEELLTISDVISEGQRIFERTIWGLTGFEDRLILSDDGTFDAAGGVYDPSGIPINNLFVADIDPSIPGLHITMLPQVLIGDINNDGVVDDADLDILNASFGRSLGDVNFNPSADLNGDLVVDVKDLALLGLNFDVSLMSTHTRPVFLWHRVNHKNALIRLKIAQPDAANSLNFPPLDILVRSQGDSFDDTFLKIIKRGVITNAPFANSPFIVVKGAKFDDLPPRGTLRLLTGAFRNSLWKYDFKAAFSQFDDDGIMLIGSDTFPFDEDFPIGTGTGADITSGDDTVPANTTVAELIHADITSPCARLEFTVNDTPGTESVKLQFKVGVLDMTLPYELNREDTIEDDLVKGMRPGFAVSKQLIQQGFITDGVGGSGVTSDPPEFKVFEGGELQVPIDGETEKFNLLEIMLRDDQLWVWWNGLIIPPDPEASAALPTPVQVDTPFFPLQTDLETGKVVLRMWPGTIIRSIEIRDNLEAFTEFTRGGLELVVGS